MPSPTDDDQDVPEDAGIYAAALASILERIPARWGRFLGIDAGWYALITNLDQQLCAIDADYVVHQVKEKFGTLRFYCVPGHEEPSAEMLDAFDTLIAKAEHLSAITCERCGEQGSLCHRAEALKTLCASCAAILNYHNQSR